VTAVEPETHADRASGTAAALRRSFDASFAVAPAGAAERQEGLLAIRIAADPYALRLTEIAGLYVDLKIVAAPSRSSQLLGIVGLRGMMAPVYDLAALMQYPLAPSARWMVLARAPQPVGFVFEGFEAHMQVQASMEIGMDAPGARTGASGRYTRGTVRTAGVLRPIIAMDAVMKLVGDNHT
jgi:chemotaxis signal transduction protein